MLTPFSAMTVSLPAAKYKGAGVPVPKKPITGPVAAPALSAAILPPRLRQTNEKAPAAVPRSQPNSLISGTISNENAVRAVTPIAIDDHPAEIEWETLRPTGVTILGHAVTRLR